MPAVSTLVWARLDAALEALCRCFAVLFTWLSYPLLALCAMSALHCFVGYFIEASEYCMQLYNHPEATQDWRTPSGRVKLWHVPWGRACTLLLLLTQTGSCQISRGLCSPPPCVSAARCSNSYWQHHLPACLPLISARCSHQGPPADPLPGSLSDPLLLPASLIPCAAQAVPALPLTRVPLGTVAPPSRWQFCFD